MRGRSVIPLLLVIAAGLASMATSRKWPGWRVNASANTEADLSAASPKTSWRLVLDGTSPVLTQGLTKAQGFDLEISVAGGLPSRSEGRVIRCSLQNSTATRVIQQSEVMIDALHPSEKCKLRELWGVLTCGTKCTHSFLLSAELLGGRTAHVKVHVSASMVSDTGPEFQDKVQLSARLEPVR